MLKTLTIEQRRLRLAALRAAAALSKAALEERDAWENAMFDLS